MNTNPSPIDQPPARAAAPAPLAAELILIAAGDERAFARLYDATCGWVHGLALRILGDAEAAEDVCLDVYQRAWQRAATFDPTRGSVTSWLLTMTRSRAIDRLRTKRATAEQEAALEEGVFDVMDPRPLPDIQAHLDDQSAFIRRALQELPGDQREVIELAFFEGLSHGKIAQHLELPLGTVKTRIRTGVRKLAERLNKLEGHQ